MAIQFNRPVPQTPRTGAVPLDQNTLYPMRPPVRPQSPITAGVGLQGMPRTAPITPTGSLDTAGRPVVNPATGGAFNQPVQKPATWTQPPAPPVAPPAPTQPSYPTPTPAAPTPAPVVPAPVAQPAATTAAPATAPNSFAPINTVQDMLTMFTDPNSAYMQQVANRASQQANSRGLLNSSIAVGNAQAAAIEAAQPFVQEAMGLQRQREGFAFEGGQNALDRAHQTQTQFDQAGLQDWLAGNAWTRDFNGALSLMPIQSTSQMLSAIMAAGLENPQVFTPSVMSGLSTFFGQNWMTTMRSLFPNAFGGGTGTIPTTQPIPNAPPTGGNLPPSQIPAGNP